MLLNTLGICHCQLIIIASGLKATTFSMDGGLQIMSKFILNDFILNTGLYLDFSVSYEDLEEIERFIYKDIKIDVYCPKCKKEATFYSKGRQPKLIGAGVNPGGSFSLTMETEKETNGWDLLDNFSRIKQARLEEIQEENRDFRREFICLRDSNHKIIIDCCFVDNSITKYGQIPSLADLNEFDIKKYRKILNDKYLELNKAIGLYSHGIGIGSFVYLRRIFENLIDEAHELAKKQDKWDENKFKTEKMDEKILLLKEFLPKFLVENRKMYGILSKGIHQLTEEECKEIFPIVRCGIELILDEKLEKLEKENKIKDVSLSLEKIQNKLK